MQHSEQLNATTIAAAAEQQQPPPKTATKNGKKTAIRAAKSPSTPTPSHSRRTPASAPASTRSKQAKRVPPVSGSTSTTTTTTSEANKKFLNLADFQPALADCFQVPSVQRRTPVRGVKATKSSPALVSQAPGSPVFRGQSSSPPIVPGFKNSMSPIKMSAPGVASIVRQVPNRPRNTQGLSLLVPTPFASAKYHDSPLACQLPPPPSWMLDDSISSKALSGSSSSLNSTGSSAGTTSPTPTTPIEVQVAKEKGFDGSIRIHPLSLIAAVSAS